MFYNRRNKLFIQEIIYTLCLWFGKLNDLFKKESQFILLRSNYDLIVINLIND